MQKSPLVANQWAFLYQLLAGGGVLRGRLLSELLTKVREIRDGLSLLLTALSGLELLVRRGHLGLKLLRAYARSNGGDCRLGGDGRLHRTRPLLRQGAGGEVVLHKPDIVAPGDGRSHADGLLDQRQHIVHRLVTVLGHDDRSGVALGSRTGGVVERSHLGINLSLAGFQRARRFHAGKAAGALASINLTHALYPKTGLVSTPYHY